MISGNAILHTRPKKTIPLHAWQLSVKNGYTLLPAQSVNNRGVRYLNIDDDINSLFVNPLQGWQGLHYICRNKISPEYIKDVMTDPNMIVMAHVIPTNTNQPFPDDWSNVLDDKRADLGRTHHKLGAFVSSIAVFEHIEADSFTPEHFYIHLICNSPTNAQGVPWDEKMNGADQGGRILAQLVEATALLNGVNTRLTPATDCTNPGATCLQNPKCATHYWRLNGYKSNNPQKNPRGGTMMWKKLVQN